MRAGFRILRADSQFSYESFDKKAVSFWWLLELEMRIELMTPFLQRKRSTAELLQRWQMVARVGIEPT
jgi:hypothetical protein